MSEPYLQDSESVGQSVPDSCHVLFNIFSKLLFCNDHLNVALSVDREANE